MLDETHLKFENFRKTEFQFLKTEKILKKVELNTILKSSKIK
jgi:hypothetical protein